MSTLTKPLMIFMALWLTVALPVGVAEATPVTAYGVPVAEIDSWAPVAECGTSDVGPGCYNASTNWINFFIPLKSTYGGVYGVDVTRGGFLAGTDYDVRNGTFTNSEILTMYLRYTPVAPLPLSSAVLDFYFKDLDLDGMNDPTGFLESVQFFSGSGGSLSPLLTIGPASTDTYTIAGNDDYQSITFHDVVGFVTGDPFFAELRFGSSMTRDGKWKNTLESMKTRLVTTAVPLPGSLGLFGIGLLIMAGSRLRALKKNPTTM